MTKYNYISFISDMGTVDESVAVCKTIMLQQAPGVTIIDVTHDVPPYDVKSAALTLVRSINFLPPGVIVVAVDPGAPKNQRFIAVELERGVLIGPDNGILAPVVSMFASTSQTPGITPIIKVHEITNPEYRLDIPDTVFAARDILAPAAGIVAAGTDISKLGNAIPIEQLVPAFINEPRIDEGGAILGEIWFMDRYGNIQLNVSPDDLQARGVSYGDEVVVRINNQEYMAKCVQTYADLEVSQLGVLPDSAGGISVVKNMASAADELGAKLGREVVLLAKGTSVTGRVVAAPDLSIPQDPSPLTTQQFVEQAQIPTQPLSGFGEQPVAPPMATPVTPTVAPTETAVVPPSFGQPEPQVQQPYAEPVQEERSLTDILGSSSMPSTFSSQHSQPEPQTPSVYSQPEVQAPPVFGQPEPQVQQPYAEPVSPEPQGTFGQPPVAPQPTTQSPFEGSVSAERVDPEEKKEEDDTSPGLGSFSGNVFDLFKSDDNENNQ